MNALPSWGLFLYLGLQRLAELRSSRANEARMRAEGGVEHAPGHYPAMLAFHLLFFAVLASSVAGGARLSPASLPWLALFAAAQALRFWSVRTLGPRWSTRVWSVPGGKGRTAGGPYRWLRHPIYLAVAAEILSVPAAYGLGKWAGALSAMNGAILTIRISAEDRCLEGEAAASPGRAPA